MEMKSKFIIRTGIISDLIWNASILVYELFNSFMPKENRITRVVIGVIIFGVSIILLYILDEVNYYEMKIVKK